MQNLLFSDFTFDMFRWEFRPTWIGSSQLSLSHNFPLVPKAKEFGKKSNAQSYLLNTLLS